ncbi:MAG: DUF1294 domain-containing protein [Planctomycetota bacterium]
MTPFQILLLAMAAISVVLFALYGLDKRAAVRHRDRIRERTLHLWSLAGGWPGALAGQAVFRHKRRKTRFMVRFWLTVLCHAGLAAGAMYLTGGFG